jgi:hypothetical protein
MNVRRFSEIHSNATKLNMRFFCVIPLLLLFVILPSRARAAGAPVGKYVEAVVQVVFSDESDSDHPQSLTDLANAGTEIHQFFSDLSYGKLDFEVHFARVHLSKTLAEYSACGSSCNYAFDATAAAQAADPTFLDSTTNGISVLILEKYAGSVTGFGFINWPGLQQQVVSSRLAEHPATMGTALGPSKVWWGDWAHEWGHQIEVFGGTNVGGPWLGHPSGYNSGYDLMDSCYPCHQSSYGLLGAPLVTDSRTVFPGWLDADHVATVPIPTSGPVGQTFVLPPLSENISNPVTQAVKVPIDDKRYYMVNARKRLTTDALQVPQTIQGIFSEGVQIQYIDESAQFPVKVCAPSTNPGCTNVGDTPPWPFLLWKAGDTFTDATQNININVVAAVTDGYEVTINRDVPPGHPDLFITPWLTPPGDTYETVDIWVDSSCNGYEDQGGLLRYGRRADGTVIGSGDDPCVNHENRVFATVHNIGDADAPATTATFQVSSPLGVGVSGVWDPLGTASVPAIPAGQSASVFVTWTPAPNLTPQQIQQMHFKFHSCVQVLVAPVSGEIVTSNNNAQENIDYFEAVAMGKKKNGVFPMPTLNGAFTLHDGFDEDGFRSFSLRSISNLPPGWTFVVNQGQTEVQLESGQSVPIPVQIVPTDSAVGKVFDLKVDAVTLRDLENPLNHNPLLTHPATHPSWYVVGGLNLSAHTVLPSTISIIGSAFSSAPGSLVEVQGMLKPARPGTIVTIDWFDANNTIVSVLAKVQSNGAFFASTAAPFSVAGVRAIWQGDMRTASAVATAAVTVKTGTPLQPGQSVDADGSVSVDEDNDNDSDDNDPTIDFSLDAKVNHSGRLSGDLELRDRTSGLDIDDSTVTSVLLNGDMFVANGTYTAEDGSSGTFMVLGDAKQKVASISLSNGFSLGPVKAEVAIRH